MSSTPPSHWEGSAGVERSRKDNTALVLNLRMFASTVCRMRTTRKAEPLLTTEEVADLLRVPVTTVYNWRTRGEGPPGLRVGRHIRFRREDVDAWIRDRLRESS